MTVANKTNVDAAAVREYREGREPLLQAIGRDATALDTSATRLARHILNGIGASLTTVELEQAALCKRFPLRTASGKVSKTPNGKVKASWDKIVMLAAILAGEHKVYTRPEAKAIAERFAAADSTMKLNEAWEAIRRDKAAAEQEARAAMSDEDKAKAKSEREAADNEAMAGAVANSAAMLNALAREIAAYTVEEHGDLITPLQAVYAAIEGFAAKVEAATAPEALAA